MRIESRLSRRDSFAPQGRAARYSIFQSLLASTVLLGMIGCGFFVHSGQEGVAVGSRAPSFNLPDPDGRKVSLEGLIAQGPAVLVFYRGHW